MLSNFTVGLLLGLGAAGYIYKVMYKNTGGNVKNAAIVAAVAGLFAMVSIIVALGAIFPS